VIQQRWKEKGYAHTTRFTAHNALRHILRHLEIVGAPIGLQNTVLKISKPEARNVVATDAEREAMLSKAPLDLRMMLLLCSDLCFRSGTALQLAPKHYNPDKDTLTIITKAQSVVELPVTDQIRELIQLCTHASRDSATPFIKLLAGSRGTSYARVHQRYMDLRKECGIKRQLTFHDLRRTTARRVLSITGDLRLVQALLGHRQINSTFHYIQGDREDVPVHILEQAKSRRRV